MKLFTNFKLKHEGFFKAIDLDWREVAIELMDDLIEERKENKILYQRIADLEKLLEV
jgi:hypothetical protein